MDELIYGMIMVQSNFVLEVLVSVVKFPKQSN